MPAHTGNARGAARAVLLLFGIGLAGACTAVLGIDDIEFGTPVATGGQGGAGGFAHGGDGGAHTGGGGSSGSSEICGNGIDDDGNELADCADPGCSCAPAAPIGWEGPFAFVPGASASAPSCGPQWPQATVIGTLVDASPATCGLCTCAAPTGGLCQLPVLSYYDDATCSNVAASFQFVNTACAVDTSPSGTLSVQLSVAGVTGATCVPSGGAPTTSAPAWADASSLCEATAGSCTTAGTVCLPKVEPPFELCVRIAGTVPCPSGPYSVPHVSFTDFTDTRDCSACACDPATGRSCTGHAQLYSSLFCGGGAIDTIPADGTTCTPVSTQIRASRYTPQGAPSGGSCAAVDAVANGNVVAASPITLCCLP